MNLTGKNVLLTSNGDEVSFNLALNLCKTGCRLVLAGNGSDFSNSAERLKNYVNDSIVSVAELDMNSTESVVDEAIQKAWRSLGHIDALVNCYAYEGNVTPPLDLKEDELDKIIRVNLKGTWLVCKAVGKRMRDNATGGSFILLTTIIGCERGLYPGASAYGACLAGVNHLARAVIRGHDSLHYCCLFVEGISIDKVLLLDIDTNHETPLVATSKSYRFHETRLWQWSWGSIRSELMQLHADYTILMLFFRYLKRIRNKDRSRISFHCKDG